MVRVSQRNGRTAVDVCLAGDDDSKLIMKICPVFYQFRIILDEIEFGGIEQLGKLFPGIGLVLLSKALHFPALLFDDKMGRRSDICLCVPMAFFQAEIGLCAEDTLLLGVPAVSAACR